MLYEVVTLQVSSGGMSCTLHVLRVLPAWMQLSGLLRVASLGLMLRRSGTLAGIVVVGLWAAVEPADEPRAFLESLLTMPCTTQYLRICRCDWGTSNLSQ